MYTFMTHDPNDKLEKRNSEHCYPLGSVNMRNFYHLLKTRPTYDAYKWEIISNREKLILTL